MKKLYLAAVEAADSASAEKDITKVNSLKVEAFKAAGFSSKQDFAVFDNMFTEQLNKFRALAEQKLPSEVAAETIG